MPCSCSAWLSFGQPPSSTYSISMYSITDPPCPVGTFCSFQYNDARRGADFDRWVRLFFRGSGGLFEGPFDQGQAALGLFAQQLFLFTPLPEACVQLVGNG